MNLDLDLSAGLLLLCFGLPSRALHEWLCVLVVCCTGKFDIKVSAPKLGIELLVSEHATTTLKGKKVGVPQLTL